MAVSLTIEQVKDRSKTVTRRRADTWRKLKPGALLTLVEQAQGLKKGEKQQVLATVEVVDVRVEPLSHIGNPGELAKEGFPDMTPEQFVVMWAESHAASAFTVERGLIQCRRIEWRYL